MSAILKSMSNKEVVKKSEWMSVSTLHVNVNFPCTYLSKHYATKTYGGVDV
jgi:hypothetical protein